MNTLEIDHVLKTHQSTRNVFKGVYARNRLPRKLNVPSALIAIGNTDPDDRPGTHWVALYIDANSRGEYYDPTGRPPFLRAYVNFMNKHCTSWTYNTVHRCAGHSMTDITRLLENPVEATIIVQIFVLLLVEHV